MNIITLDFIKNILKKPTFIFSLITILLSLIILFGCHFQYPDFYSNRELADQIAQTVSPQDVEQAVKHLLNPRYNIFNIIFQIWGWCVTLLIFSATFRIDKFSKFRQLPILNKKLFIYLWINLSYLIWGFAYISGYMINLEKYVYNGAADTFAIPLFGIISALIFIGVIYYLITNLLAFITYNTKIKRIFYNFLWFFLFIFWLILTIDTFTWQFSYYHLILDLYYFITLILIIYAMGFNKNLEVK